MQEDKKVNGLKRVYPRRLQAVVSPDELEIVEKAAAIKGLSLSAFASKAAVASAKRVVAKEG
ncbi:DUF1778 domain-containing protein [Neisseria sp. N95_16]|uniref:DUF1778 domain-containing protein n=1 Tax=Neisseria brasiliensis TaxID=2666100 RepID=A0A7X2GWD9_9NEIS|nr:MULTISPECIES: DUF1778 domain-containing protein [Neisseria]MRN37220.1 DUF1778 domain-containing protein [Neisseria brasiliensis]PJO09229.1 DUF1778 domain-containing protein [Neisseria sp. N95_16]